MSKRIKKRTLVEIIWLDPAKNEMKIDDLKKVLESNSPLKQFLIKSTSYGVIITGDNEVILLKNHENEIGDREFKTIPRVLIQKIIPYPQGNKAYSDIGYYLAHFS
jgi:hypothetical protein